MCKSKVDELTCNICKQNKIENMKGDTFNHPYSFNSMFKWKKLKVKMKKFKKQKVILNKKKVK